MDFTTIPRSLLYKEKKTLKDFGIYDRNQLNTQLYVLLKYELKATVGNSDYTILLKTLFNEAYYLCTIILMDEDAIMHFREYVDAILVEHTLPEVYKERFRRIVCAICYVYLEDIANRLDDIFTIRRHLRTCSYEYMPIIDETAAIKRPSESEFQPVELTKELLSKIDWRKVTDKYDVHKIECLLRSLGRNSFEKKRLAFSIYSSIFESGDTNKLPARLEPLLFSVYEQYGGNRKELLAVKEKKMLKENKEDLASRIKQLEQEKLAQQKRIRDLEIKNNVLAKDRADLEKKIKILEEEKTVKIAAQQNQKQIVEAVKAKLKTEMESHMQNLQVKLGHLQNPVLKN